LSPAILNINNSGICLFQNDKVLYREIGIILNSDQGLLVGSKAMDSRRILPKNINYDFWSDLSESKIRSSLFSDYSSADLVSYQLKEVQQFINNNDPIIIIYPSYLDSENLSLLLGIANALDIQIITFIESSIAATKEKYFASKIIHLDIHLHGITASLMTDKKDVSVEESIFIEECGLFQLYDNWIKLITESCIEQLRYDPMHSAKTDQMLYNKVSKIIDEVTKKNKVTINIDSEDVSKIIEINSSAFIDAVNKNYRNLVTKLRSLFSRDDNYVIQLTQQIAELPGLITLLESSFSCHVRVLDDLEPEKGACRFNTSALDNNIPSICRVLPYESEIEVDHGKGDRDSFAPTHILHDHVAYEISDIPIYIGTDVKTYDRYIKLDPSSPGISRKHCSIYMQEGHCIFSDLSRYGSFLNERRVKEEIVLQKGDLLKIGSPSIEFKLISIER
tara:strand:+ start:156 stop:1502 length:1347 start_codon:yes stop_codon:yes gene_type:complete